MDSPKLFISYSWSNPEHEQRVIDFASELRQAGVDAILDKWDLKEGQDAVVFMEKMVNDPDIKKVAIISDKIYTAKANDREGGVGTETQIISKEIYDKVDNTKFVVVVFEKNEDGDPYLPTYYKSRIYIDLSENDRYLENFEKMLRWIYDKPLHIKPEIGQKPSFLEEGEAISLKTSHLFQRAVEALRNNKSYASGALKEYFDTFANNLESFRITNKDVEFDEIVIQSINDFMPYRNELIKIFNTISQFASNQENINLLHKFFENIAPFMNRPEHIKQWQESDFDNYSFIVHELFLYLITILIKNECFEQANNILEQQFFIPSNADYGHDGMCSYTIFRKHMRSLEHRNNRLKLRRLSLRADLLKERCSGTGFQFRDLLQTDFILFLRAEIENVSIYKKWYPETLVYIDGFQRPFEVFARASSTKYFDRIKCLLAIDSLEQIEWLLNEYEEGSKKLPRWQFESFNPTLLLGFDKLASRP